MKALQLVLAAVASAGPSVRATPAADVELGLPPVRAPLVLPAPGAGEELTLAQVVDRFAEANDITVACEAEVRAELEASWCRLGSAVTVPGARPPG